MVWPQNPTRPSRCRYNGFSASNGAPSYPFPDDPTHNSYNRSAPRPRGRGGYVTGRSGGRGRGRWSSRPEHESSHRINRFPFDISDEFNELDLNGEVENGGAINFDAYESVPVEVSGDDVPPPVNAFAETDLDEGLKMNIERCKYVKPTPIQRHAIPIVAAGRDLMACAQTGSGKTAAFCFPIISGILKGRSAFSTMGRGGIVAYPTALILSPTRELSCQVFIIFYAL